MWCYNVTYHYNITYIDRRTTRIKLLHNIIDGRVADPQLIAPIGNLQGGRLLKKKYLLVYM